MVVDISPLFPEYEKAEAHVSKGDNVDVLLFWPNGDWERTTINLGAMANTLDRLRLAQSQAKT